LAGTVHLLVYYAVVTIKIKLRKWAANMLLLVPYILVHAYTNPNQIQAL
jgi:hypothetical protein